MSPLRFFSSFEAPVETGDFEETFAENSDPQNEFDMIIGAIEDIVVDDRFQELHNRLLEQNYQHFEDTEENKLIYTELFQTYTTTIETHIETELSQRFPQFSMETFLAQLASGDSALLQGEIFELLHSLSDFLTFKEMFLDYKLMKQQHGNVETDLSLILSVSSMNR